MKHVLVMVLCLAVTGYAAIESGKVSGIRVRIVLQDGSRLMGIIMHESIPFQTSHGLFNIPVELIKNAKVESETNAFRVYLKNGDEISGSIEYDALLLDTVLGKHSFPVSIIKSMTVSPIGVEPLASDWVLGTWNFHQHNGAWLFDVEVTRDNGLYEFRLIRWNNNVYRNSSFEHGRLVSRLRYDEKGKFFQGEHYQVENGQYYDKITANVINPNYLNLEGFNRHGVNGQSLRRPPDGS